MRILVVGHLPIHLDPLQRGLRQLCDLDVMQWEPIPLLRRGSSLLIVPLLVLRILFRSRLGIDLILAQYAFPDGFSSVLSSRLLGTPSVIQVIGSDILIAAKGLKGRLIRWAVSRASGVICVSHELEELVREMGAEKTTVIPSPLDVSDLPPTKGVKRFERRLVTVALLTKVKGLSTLLNALGDLNDFELLIVGDGPERDSLERQAESLEIQDKVRFIGQVSHEKIWEYLLSSSIFILPSLSEGLPRALLEAMACGLFVVASKVGGIPEVVRDGWNGILVDPGDVQALREAVKRALADKNLIETVGERNKREAQEFTLEKVSMKQLQFFSSTVARKRRDGVP